MLKLLGLQTSNSVYQKKAELVQGNTRKLKEVVKKEEETIKELSEESDSEADRISDKEDVLVGIEFHLRMILGYQ